MCCEPIVGETQLLLLLFFFPQVKTAQDTRCLYYVVRGLSVFEWADRELYKWGLHRVLGTFGSLIGLRPEMNQRGFALILGLQLSEPVAFGHEATNQFPKLDVGKEHKLAGFVVGTLAALAS